MNNLKYYYSYQRTRPHFYCGKDIADENPKEPGEYLLPAYATFEEPPSGKEDYAVYDIENKTWAFPQQSLLK